VIGLASLPGSGAGSQALGVNDGGQIVGWAVSPGGSSHAALWAGGTVTDLGTLPGDRSSQATDINASGQVVGWSKGEDGMQRAVLWTDGEVTALQGIPD